MCVYCGSRGQVELAYGELADELGAAIGQRGWSLVYGGGSVGLMGRVARATQANGGSVLGVIPASMDKVEIAYRDAEELVVVDTMRQRKQLMDDRADVFVVLPGGFGTLEELSEVITHRYLNYHTKPIVIVNHGGFYDPLLELFKHFVEHGFASESYQEMYEVVTDIPGVLSALDG